ncbi:uncharacterized protein BT62DRAFT_1013412 [Guyanagaster necrorhizus]|uniref:Uncharacterized protein n=1 Tax=Guyanagaster necrorhizus TaxID=856835 RepID=A0A9P8AL51_9AGAR|nr:uncharacterized protein BT62DRAFT_1013412 [Guyanagaster necrorhizus MCA 3950]KAG7439863.1 hypothetical protein BT62DRAFT_1013412 [Guyanagaster necrorhizus MCA 3950]
MPEKSYDYRPDLPPQDRIYDEQYPEHAGTFLNQVLQQYVSDMLQKVGWVKCGWEHSPLTQNERRMVDILRKEDLPRSAVRLIWNPWIENWRFDITSGHMPALRNVEEWEEREDEEEIMSIIEREEREKQKEMDMQEREDHILRERREEEESSEDEAEPDIRRQITDEREPITMEGNRGMLLGEPIVSPNEDLRAPIAASPLHCTSRYHFYDGLAVGTGVSWSSSKSTLLTYGGFQWTYHDGFNPQRELEEYVQNDSFLYASSMKYMSLNLKFTCLSFGMVYTMRPHWARIRAGEYENEPSSRLLNHRRDDYSMRNARICTNSAVLRSTCERRHGSHFFVLAQKYELSKGTYELIMGAFNSVQKLV